MSAGKVTLAAVLGSVVVAGLCIAGVAVVGESGPGTQPQAAAEAAPDGGAPRKGTIPDGTWRVGDEIKAGTYVTTVPGGAFPLCMWQRLSGFSGDADEMIDFGSGSEGDRMRVTIKKSDAGFKSDGCGIWKLAKP